MLQEEAHLHAWPLGSSNTLTPFLLFPQPKLFTVPLKASYVWGLLTVIVFIVLLLMQTNTIAGNNKYL